jgi:hypothetical protein
MRANVHYLGAFSTKLEHREIAGRGRPRKHRRERPERVLHRGGRPGFVQKPRSKAVDQTGHFKLHLVAVGRAAAAVHDEKITHGPEGQQG